MNPTKRLNCYVIYFKPLDHMQREPYVVRRFEITQRGVTPKEFLCYRTLEEARSSLPKGVVKIEKSEEDKKSVIESWI